MLDQRASRVDRDFEGAVGRLVDVGCELHDVAGVEIAVRIRRRHIPFGLRRSDRADPRMQPTSTAQTRTKFFIGLSTISSTFRQAWGQAMALARAMPKKSAQIGSTPFALSVAAAAGAVRKRISACAASRSFAEALKPAGKTDLGLQVLRNGSDQIDAGHAGDARRHHHDHVGFPARDNFDRVFGRHRLELALHLGLDAEPIEQADEIESARALAGIGNGFRRQQRALEGLRR